MSFYNMFFGINPQTELLLAVVGLRNCDVQRLRNVFVESDGAVIAVYTRTGGGNRSDYPNLVMRKRPEWTGSEDDDFDSTYCTDRFAVPAEFVADVAALSDVLGNGLRREFCAHLAKTLRREPTRADVDARARDEERAALSRTKHIMLNGHTFVPLDDYAMEQALQLAEANGGELRTCLGIAPMALAVYRDRERFGQRIRAEIDAEWATDAAYWSHARDRFGEKYPRAIAKIRECVEKYPPKKESR